MSSIIVEAADGLRSDTEASWASLAWGAQAKGSSSKGINGDANVLAYDAGFGRLLEVIGSACADVQNIVIGVLRLGAD